MTIAQEVLSSYILTLPYPQPFKRAQVTETSSLEQGAASAILQRKPVQYQFYRFINRMKRTQSARICGSVWKRGAALQKLYKTITGRSLLEERLWWLLAHRQSKRPKESCFFFFFWKRSFNTYVLILQLLPQFFGSLLQHWLGRASCSEVPVPLSKSKVYSLQRVSVVWFYLQNKSQKYITFSANATNDKRFIYCFVNFPFLCKIKLSN